MNVNLKSLIEKLNPQTRNALEAAAGLCVSRTNYDVEIEHYLTKLLDSTTGDTQKILSHFGINASQLAMDLGICLDSIKTGNARTPNLSPHLVQLFRQAWVLGSIEYSAPEIRTGLTWLALIADADLSRIAADLSPQLKKIQVDELRGKFLQIVTGSDEDESRSKARAKGGPAAAANAKTPNLDKFTADLTENARLGKLDTVLGRDGEIRQVVDILMRRRQNNPILTGEPGVGKTAIVEGFAMRVATGEVPAPLRNVVVRSLDLALLQAGAGVKGEFENRLKSLIEEVKSSPVPVILFIDEAHTMIGAGGQAGQGDAANILKPALARGELRTIAATTWSEYKKYFEKDAALARRFQVVKVDEPAEETCMTMLRGLIPILEKHHGVRILESAISAATKLTHRYMVGRQLPDKAVSVLDTACARLALGSDSIPPPIEDATRRLDDLNVQKRILERETAAGADHEERLGEIAAAIEKEEKSLAELRTHWEFEQNLVKQIRELRKQLETGLDGKPVEAKTDGKAAEVKAPPADPKALREQISKMSGELDAHQGDKPLIRVCVDGQTVSEVVGAWTGIPVGKMLKDDLSMILDFEHHLEKRVVGQSHALAAISQRIRTSRASLDDPGRPVGVFLLAGPSGVGKTETALALSDLLYGGERNLISINMSEFQEAHTVSSLKGSPPGYVGYGEGGVLTEAVRRRPYAVVLLDEVEKAHPDVLELFYQVFDKGVMEDGEGREIDFKNTIIILTTNAATDTMMKLCGDPEAMPSPDALVRAIKPELNKIFKPALLGRLVVVSYFPVRDEILKQIIVLKMAKIQRRILENHKLRLTYDPAFLEEVAKRCTEVESGARNVDNILTNTLLPDISRRVLSAMAEGQKPAAIHVGIGEDGAFTYSQAAQASAGG